MSDPIKFTADELQKVHQLRQELTAANLQYGQLSFSKRMLEKEIIKIEDKYDELLGREDAVVAELNAKYGVGTLNLETGEFVPTS